MVLRGRDVGRKARPTLDAGRKARPTLDVGRKAQPTLDVGREGPAPRWMSGVKGPPHVGCRA